MPKRGRSRKKTRTHVSAAEENQSSSAQSALVSKQEEKVPKSLVIRRGKTAPQVADLVTDIRHMMLPFTAAHFEEDAKNRKLTLNQYVQHLALPMGISHLMSFSQSEQRLNMRLARTPEGPTLTFRVDRFSLNRDIKALQRRPVAYTPSLHSNPPVVVTNNFGPTTSTDNTTNSNKSTPAALPHVKLMRITFQNLFPAINVSTVKLRDCRRVVLFQLVEQEDADSNNDGKMKQIVQVRHYAVTAKPVGVNRRVRRLIQTNRKLPNLNKCQDIAEYLESQAIMSDGGASDSEAEEDETQQVVLSQKFVGRGNSQSQRSALKLVEIGPRLDLHLIKVEKGLGSGDVLYHAFVEKTPAEAAALKQKKQAEANLKERRRAEQEANVERKRKATAEKLAKKRQKQLEREQKLKVDLEEEEEGGDQQVNDDEDESESEVDSDDESR